MNVQANTSQNVEDKSESNILSLFDNEVVLKNINYELFASNKSDPNLYSKLEEIVRQVTNNRISEIKVVNREVLFVERLTNGDEMIPLPLGKLAAGFKSIINMVFDIYLRFQNAHNTFNPAEFFGIVFIDEIENHLHPILQKELPLTLSRVFPKLQFITTTHSPIPLLGAPKNSIILRVNRTLESGIKIERLDEIIDFPNLLPNTILTSPIFGFIDIFSSSKDVNKYPKVENTYNELSENEKQKERIKDYLSKENADEILKLLKK